MYYLNTVPENLIFFLDKILIVLFPIKENSFVTQSYFIFIPNQGNRTLFYC